MNYFISRTLNIPIFVEYDKRDVHTVMLHPSYLLQDEQIPFSFGVSIIDYVHSFAWTNILDTTDKNDVASTLDRWPDSDGKFMTYDFISIHKILDKHLAIERVSKTLMLGNPDMEHDLFSEPISNYYEEVTSNGKTALISPIDSEHQITPYDLDSIDHEMGLTIIYKDKFVLKDDNLDKIFSAYEQDGFIEKILEDDALHEFSKEAEFQGRTYSVKISFFELENMLIVNYTIEYIAPLTDSSDDA